MTTTTVVLLVWGCLGWGSGVYWARRFGQQREALEKIAVQIGETIRLVERVEGTLRERVARLREE